MKFEFKSKLIVKYILLAIFVVGISAVSGAVGYNLAKPKCEIVPNGEIVKEEVKERAEVVEVIDSEEVVAEVVADVIADWKIYRNEEVGFELKYPKDYIEKKEEMTNFALGSLRENYDVPMIIFDTQIDYDGNVGLGDFYLEIIDNPDKLSLSEWFEKNDIPEFGTTNIILAEINDKKITVDNVIGIDRILAGEGGGVRSIIIPKDNKIIILNVYSSNSYPNYRDSSYEKNKYINGYEKIEEFNQIINTFKFIEKEESVNLKTYKDEKVGVEFQYPADFLFYKTPEIIASKVDPDAISIKKWIEEENDTLVILKITNGENTFCLYIATEDVDEIIYNDYKYSIIKEENDYIVHFVISYPSCGVPDEETSQTYLECINSNNKIKSEVPKIEEIILSTLKFVKDNREVLILYPDIGVAWNVGKSYDVLWIPVGRDNSVEIKLFNNEKSEETRLQWKSSDVPSPGKYEFVVSESLEQGGKYQLEISEYGDGNTYVSNSGEFSIVRD